jgi:Tfp pilus assembly protein PilE
MRPWPQASAFTVIELLLVLALLGIVSGVFIHNFDAFQETFFENRTPQAVLEEAVHKARFYASREHQICHLTFSPDTKKLDIKIPGGPTLESFVLSHRNGAQNQITFLEAVENESARFGWTTHQRENKLLSFEPDGSGSHVFIKISSSDRTETYRLDPFSGILMPEKI